MYLLLLYFLKQVAPSTALAASLQAFLLVKQPRPAKETHHWVDGLAGIGLGRANETNATTRRKAATKEIICFIV